jgi:hypothetical protein
MERKVLGQQSFCEAQSNTTFRHSQSEKVHCTAPCLHSMPRTRRNVRRRVQLSSHGPAIANLYARDASESDAVEYPSSSLSIDEPPPISGQQKPQVEANRDSSDESDAGWSDDNDLSSDLGYSLSLSSSGNHDEEGTISTKTSHANKANKDTSSGHYSTNDDEHGYPILPDKSIEEDPAEGQQNEDSSSSSDGASSRSKSSSATTRSDSGMSRRSGSGRSDHDESSSRSGDESSRKSASGDESSRRSDSGDESSRSHSNEQRDYYRGTNRQDSGPMQQRQNFYPEDFADQYFPEGAAAKPVDETPKIRMFSTLDDILDGDQEPCRRASRRFSLNERAVFRLIDAADNIDCAASDPGWRNEPKTNPGRRSPSFCSFEEGEFGMLAWQDENSDDERKNNDRKFQVPQVVSTDSAENDGSDDEYDDDELRDNTRNYDARYDRDLSEITPGRTDRSYRIDDDNEGDDSEDDPEENNTYNRSVASYISGDNSSRSQHDPFLRPHVGDGPPTPPSPLKPRTPRNKSQSTEHRANDDQQQEQLDSYHGLPIRSSLPYNRDEAPNSWHSAEDGSESGADSFPSNFRDGYEHVYQYNGDGIENGDVLPQIDENNPVHHDHTIDPRPSREIDYGESQHLDKYAKERRRDRKIIRLLSAGLGCALLALSAVLGGVIAASLLHRRDTPSVAGIDTPVSLSPQAPPLKLPTAPSSRVPDQPISLTPSRQPTGQQITRAPQIGAPTRVPTESPMTDTPSLAPVRATVAPTPTPSSSFGIVRIP